MKNYIRMGVTYCLGLFIMALGVAFAIISDLGVSPVSSIPYIVSLITKIDLGICTTVVLALFIFAQMILLGKQFKWRSWLQIIGSSIFGFFVSLATYITSSIQVGDDYLVRLLFCLLSVVLIAIGVFLYLMPNVLPLPGEGVMLAMTVRFGIPLHKAKTIFDCSVVIVAGLLSMLFLHEIDGIREGTLISAICVGICIKFVQKIYDKFSIK